MSRFDCLNTPLIGLKIIQRKPIQDSRGFLSRFYCSEAFSTIGINKPIVQINHTHTRQKGAVRGLHFQHPPFAETKVVSCIKGEIFDIAVDIRQGSPTFLKWHAEILNAQNQRSLMIPEGFAHGFQTLTDDCELIYLHTAAYHQPSEGALNIHDSLLGIQLPLEITDLSERDRMHAMITNDFLGLAV
ncbi:dTDP-4-dehydrorhamnose 3,5-epimerase [Methylotenera sp. N17]|uniref:dTDP-4-dehydrorhamnose 3,5-epimerase n=1 Tax=Methylotenera sp. N17 TaxID=1502761 RepID=UPI00064561E6|nr:dTDP-4-dehydrorhamnose 3,5-epimerase [Methylotenera sp. N17]